MGSPSESQGFDVFISYHSGDAGWVQQLKTGLQCKGFKVWVDSDQIMPGDRFAEALERGLQSSKSAALIVSSGSLRSNWVKEEYYRALGLANTTERNFRLIPVLIESVAVPAFLASRSWVDFRDPAKFEDNLERLCRGIRGIPPSDAETRPATASIAANSATGIDELAYLDRARRRELSTLRQGKGTRYAAPLIGLVVSGGIILFVNPEIQAAARASAVAGSALITGAIGWGVTARQLSLAQQELTRLECLRDGLDMCRARTEEACAKLRAEFWRFVHRKAGIDQD